MRSRECLVLVLTALAFRDSRSQATPNPEWITTDSTRYTAHAIGHSAKGFYRFRVITKFLNRSQSDVYLGRCFPDSPRPQFTIWPEKPGATASAYAQFWACVGHDRQFRIAAGGVRVDTFDITGPASWHGIDPANHDGALEGKFRIGFPMKSTPGDRGREVMDWSRLSNVFQVRTSRR
jgi:hypothetical protein